MSIPVVPAVLAAVAFSVTSADAQPGNRGPAVAASLCSRLWHHYSAERRQLRPEGKRSRRHKNGHAVLLDRPPTRNPDVGHRRDSGRRLQGRRHAPEALQLHGRSPAASATRRDTPPLTSPIWRFHIIMAITSPTPASSPNRPGLRRAVCPATVSKFGTFLYVISSG
jgi:hypothetical protein